MSSDLYKWLDGRQATHVPTFCYRLRTWTPPVEGALVPCANGYHLMRVQHLSYWVARDLFVAEYEGELVEDGDKLVARRVRIVEHLKGWNERTARLAAADFAERVLPIFEKQYPTDDRPRLAIQATRDCANGLVSSAEAAGAAWAPAAAEAAAAAWAAEVARAAGAAARAALAAGAAQRATWVAEAASWAAWAAEAAEAAAAALAAGTAWAAGAAAAAEAAAAALARAGAAGAAWAAGAAEREWQGQRILDYAYGMRT